MKRVLAMMELTDGQYEVLQKLSTMEKKDHSVYTQEALLQLMEADIDIYFQNENPEYQQLIDKLGLEEKRRQRMEERKGGQEGE